MEKREPFCIVGRNVKLVQPLWKTVWRLLKKLKVEPPYDPAVPLLGLSMCTCGYKQSNNNSLFCLVQFFGMLPLYILNNLFIIQF